MKQTLPVSLIALAGLIASCGSDIESSRLVLGTSNQLYELDGGLQYQMPFSVQVTDANGQGISGASVVISYTALTYHKGYYQKVDTDSPADGTLDQWSAIETITCAAEDINQNAVADAGEDIDGDSILEPTNSASFTAHPALTPTLVSGNSLITDEEGLAYFALAYPKSEALWVTLRVQATTSVEGTEYREIFDSRLPVLQEDAEEIDIAPPSGQTNSRYGVTADCTNPM